MHVWRLDAFYRPKLLCFLFAILNKKMRNPNFPENEMRLSNWHLSENGHMIFFVEQTQSEQIRGISEKCQEDDLICTDFL